MNTVVAEKTSPKEVIYDLHELTGIDTGGIMVPLPGFDRLPEGVPHYEADPTHEFDKKLVRWILYALQNSHRRKRVQLVGPTRCGKTSTVRELLLRARIPAIFVQCHPDMEIYDLFGDWVLGEKGMVKVFGPVTQAMKNGWVVVLEERDTLSPKVNAALHGLMDTGIVVLEKFGGEVVKAEKGFAMLATANTSGNGDSSGIYPTSLIQSAASNLRWLNVSTDYLAKEKEIALLNRIYLPKVKKGTEQSALKMTINSLVDFANETRRAVKAGQMMVPFATGSIRECLDAYLALGSIREGVEGAYLNGIGDSDLAAGEEFYKNVVNVFDYLDVGSSTSGNGGSTTAGTAMGG